MKHRCPVCGEYEFEGTNSYDICPYCNWEDNEFQEEEPDNNGGPNKMSLNQAREAFKKGEKVL